MVGKWGMVVGHLPEGKGRTLWNEGDDGLTGLVLDALSWGVEEAGPLTHSWLNLHVVFTPAASRLR